MTLTQVTLGARLRDARRGAGLTQEAVADAVELPRTALVQIENGNRSVGSFELLRLARLYGRDVAEFLSDAPMTEDPLVYFRRQAADEGEPIARAITDCLEMLREAGKLQNYLGEQSAALPPVYEYRDPTSYREAVSQGREIALRERDRLNIGSAPISDVAELISQQSVRAAAVPLDDDVSGLFLHHPSCGLAVLVNQTHSRVRQRFSYAHEYAHALADRDKATAPSGSANASHLVEKRANAFAGEFLMPAKGVLDALGRMRKGANSREHSLLYDPASNSADEHESRNDSEAQRITVREVAILANEFMVSYDVAVYRLSDIHAIRNVQKEELLARREDGRILISNLKLYDGDETEPDQRYLQRQLVLLGLEAFSQGKITGGRFRDVCRLAGYPSDELLRVAESINNADEQDAG